MTPIEHVQQDTLGCLWEAPNWIIFSSEVPALVYYSHLFPAAAVLILAAVLAFRSSRQPTTWAFFVIAILFAAYSFFDLVVWASIEPKEILFFWSSLIYLEPLIYIAFFYLVYWYIHRADVPLSLSIILLLLLMPLILLGPSNLNLAGFDYRDCWRLAVEGSLSFYVYFAEFIIVLMLIVSSVLHIKKKDVSTEHRKQSGFLLFGSILFLLALTFGNLAGTLLQGVLGEEAWTIGQYGFFGMPVFLAFIMYLMVRYQIFATRVIYAEAIMLGVFVALLSLLFIPDVDVARPVIIITVVLVGFLGYLLVHGVKNDARQREEIERLAHKLEQANKRLKALDKLKSEFVSIASHQLRSPLTSIRGYATMLVEGSFGNIPEKAKEPLQRIERSAQNMALSIEDYLNVSRIESGNMKYNYSDFNLKDMAETITDDIRQQAMKKGLVMSFKSDLNSKGIVSADKGKTEQILHNLINNALKYTPKGSITVFVHDNKKAKKIYVEVIDTGVGMEPDTIEHLFDKFERAKNANNVNASGAGLGLFVARKMARAMQGDVTAHSEGEGEGSHFILELPLQM